MGYKLVNTNGEKLIFDLKGWGLLLHMAEQYGWRPAGTDAPMEAFAPKGVWDGNYYAKAACLTKTLDDLLDHDTSGEESKRTFTSFEEWRTFEPTLAEALRFFSGSGKQKVQDIIAFCRKGGFYIY